MGRCCGVQVVVAVVVMLVGGVVGSMEGGSSETRSNLREECREDVDKLIDCIAYATGKEEEPTEGCCRKVKELRDTHPVCLCYVIQKANCGRQAVFSMVLQIQRLMSLPDSCHLTGFNNITICPALLDLPKGHPDYAIFNGSDPQRQSVECATNDGFGIRFNNAGRFALAASSAIFASIFSF